MYRTNRHISGLIIAMALATTLLALAACASSAGENGGSESTESATGTQSATEPVNRGQGRNVLLTDDPSIGPADAPVTLVEFGDFGCIDCKDWQDAGTLKELKAKYGDNIRIVWRDYPIVTLQSPKASEAARCAHDQGKFWEYHDLLFERFPDLEISDLKAYAAEMGLDKTVFDQCLDGGWHAEEVDRGLREATDLGFLGVPSFLVNEKRLVGVLDADYLQSVIDPLMPAS